MLISSLQLDLIIQGFESDLHSCLGISEFNWLEVPNAFMRNYLNCLFYRSLAISNDADMG